MKMLPITLYGTVMHNKIAWIIVIFFCGFLWGTSCARESGSLSTAERSVFTDSLLTSTSETSVQHENARGYDEKPILEQDLPHFFDDEEPEILAEKIINAMSYEELLAQTFMFGWAGQNPNTRVADWVDSGLGSIKIFGWNTANTVNLAQAIRFLQSRALESRFGIPLFVATDQEGGIVRHVKGLTSETPGALACGASGIPQDSFNAGFFIGRELAEIGINVNFAPTADIYSDYNSSVIATRSFGDNPHKVAQLIVAFAKGLEKAGVLATAKHFPGHGDTNLDSHGRLPRIDISYDVFCERELVPFRAAVHAGVPFVMSGHLNFPQFMNEHEPATFSYKILTELLREEIGFQGLVVTDDMMMGAALNYAGSFSRAVTMALQAGNNIIESSSTPAKTDSVWIENIALMKTDAAFYETVRASAYRIVLEKLRYFKSEQAVPILPNTETLQEHFPIEHSESFFTAFAARSITEIKKTSPSFAGDESVLFISDYANFLNLARRRFPNATTVYTSQWQFARNFDTVVFCVSDMASQNAFLNLQRQFPNKTYIIISALSPMYVRPLVSLADTVLATYSYSDYSFQAAFACLCGDIQANGKMPLENIDF